MINTETSKRKAVLTLISLDNIYSLGVRTLSSYLKARDFQVNAIFFKASSYGNHQTSNNWEILLDLLAKIGTDIVGLSVKTPYLKLATDITNKIHEVMKIKVIWGGTHPTILPEESIQVADIICKGEGEYALLELLERLYKGDALYGIQNLWIRDGNNIHRNSQRPLLQDDDLNALPFPDYNSEDMYFVNNGFVTKGDPVINNSFEEYDTIASRGCPFRCSYCVNSILRDIYPKGSKFIRKRDPENVVNEIEHALNVMPNIQKIRFQDEVFPWEENWLAEFRDVYKRRINLPFVCTYHPNMVNENRIGRLRDAGMATLGLGIQSACEKIRQQVFARP
ncbi:MAG TPA: cobalamin-dependent protein, partial [Thermodesulfovibrionales bacterium]|nr:cobalamin-dependent protein [Thermodesulfovibrionales bacterium]